jgi:hypothetical protein
MPVGMTADSVRDNEHGRLRKVRILILLVSHTDVRGDAPFDLRGADLGATGHKRTLTPRSAMLCTQV